MALDNLKNNRVKLSFIIVNYNLADEIKNCLNSLIPEVDSQLICYEIIIVDNNSPDKKLPTIEKYFKRDKIHFYYLEENVGFGKGCNYGFTKASGEYICFLNPDTIINQNIFSPILSAFQNDRSIGIIGPRQQVKSSLFDFSAGFYPNILFELFNLIGAGVFFEGFIVNLYARLMKGNQIKVDWILGAAIFIKAELFRLIDGFDKDYFMFFEEVDLCKRVSNLGYSIMYRPDLEINHIGSVSGKKNYTLYTIRTYSSKNIYISKHYKHVHKFIMKSLLRIQLISQILIWTLLMPLNRKKSLEKLRAFFYLIRNNFRLVTA